MSGPRLRRRSALAAASLLVTGCATLRLIVYRPPHLDRCPGALVPTEQIAGDFLRRLQMHVSAGDVDTGYQLVLQKKGDRLVLIGLTRFGARAFSVVQQGGTVQVDSALGPATVVPPGNVLRDLHRTLFFNAGPPPASGEIATQHDGEMIRETWRDGTLERRVFSTADGEVVLDFDGPHRVRIRNQRCGYTATLVDVDANAAGAGGGDGR